MKLRLAVVVLFLGGILYLIISSTRPATAPTEGERPRSPSPAEAQPSSVDTAQNGASATARSAGPDLATTGSQTTSASAGANKALSAQPPEYTNLPPETVLENLRTTFHSFQSMFGGNPVGTNPEITAALNAGNPRQAQFLRADYGLRVNTRGELVDPWGMPYFFHQLSSTEMEIRSAGPDKLMWTADDLVIR